VELYVYDLSQGMARQLSLQFLGKAIDGVWLDPDACHGKTRLYNSLGCPGFLLLWFVCKRAVILLLLRTNEV
jgi:hypothetical protein